MSRYFIGLLVAAGLIVLIIVLLFSGGGKPATKGVAPKSLPSYANTSAVAEMTIDGPVTAAQNHNSIEIIVGQNNTTFNLIQGYDNDVIKSQTYNNTTNGYSVFLYSLFYAGFTKGSNASDLKNNTGYCSAGNQYIFELSQNGQDIERYWSTNCSGTPRTYEGDLGQTINLFEDQVPNYGSLVSGTDI